MARRTRVVAIIGTVVIVSILILALIPVLFRDRIMARVKAEVNQSVNARVNWREASLGLFRHFPNFTLALDDLSIANTGRFAGDTLARVGQLQVVLDLGSVLRNLRGRGPIVVRSVSLDRPVVALRVLPDGTTNWDITKPSEAQPSSSRPLDVSLRGLEIRDGTLTLDDSSSRLIAAVRGFRQTLSGDFAADVFDIATTAHANAVTVRFAEIPYLSDVALDLTAAIHADTRAKTYTFRKNELTLNDLRLAFDGSVTSAGDNLGVDITFGAPSTDFRHILSLVPAIYSQDFQRLQTSGALAVSGQVKGAYGEKAFPSFTVTAKVTNGAFKYPDLPLPARDIGLDLALRNPGGDVDSTVVQLDRFHASIGGQPIDGTMVLRTPVSDPDVDLRLAGTLDLADLRKTVKLDNVNELAGRIAADIAVRTRMSLIDRKQYDRIMARGTIGVRDLQLRSADLAQPLAIDTASLRLTPQRADLPSLVGRLGTSDVRLTGYIENLVPFALRGDPLRGSATVASRHFNLDEWQSDDDSSEVISVPANIDFGLQARIAELTYGKLTMRDARGGVHVGDQRATLDSFTVNTLGGQIDVTGFYDTKDASKPAFDVAMNMRGLDIPTAFAELATVRALAPVARYARGQVSTTVTLAGVLGKDMLPLFGVLDGQGSLRTSDLVLEGLPIMTRVADALKLERLRNPTLDSIRASFTVHDGRVHVNPFTVRLGSLAMGITGSHGLDQTMDYTMTLRVPRAELGADANRVVAGLISRAGRTGIDLQAADTVALAVKLGGTVSNPTVQTNLGEVVTSTAQNVAGAVKEQVTERVDSARQAVDSAARAKAKAEADRIVAEAEQQATKIREEAKRLADNVRREAAERADSLVAKATNPLAKTAARVAADRVKKEANDRADQIEREADQRATTVVEEARRRAAAITGS